MSQSTPCIGAFAPPTNRPMAVDLSLNVLPNPVTMRKVILSMNITLDGYMAGSGGELDWHFQSWNEEMMEYTFEQLSGMGAILLGRMTYQTMANYWPSVTDSFADMMNNYPKIVFSRTLKTVKWKNSRLVAKDIGEEVMKLKQQPGKDMIIYGSGSIATTFIQLGLVDEYRLWVHPVVLGRGHSLFKDAPGKVDLRFIDTRIFSSGVAVLSYEVMKKQAIKGSYQ